MLNIKIMMDLLDLEHLHFANVHESQDTVHTLLMHIGESMHSVPCDIVPTNLLLILYGNYLQIFYQ